MIKLSKGRMKFWIIFYGIHSIPNVMWGEIIPWSDFQLPFSVIIVEAPAIQCQFRKVSES